MAKKKDGVIALQKFTPSPEGPGTVNGVILRASLITYVEDVGDYRVVSYSSTKMFVLNSLEDLYSRLCNA